MATKAEILKHYQDILRREWELESRFASIRRELGVIAERKKMLEAAILNDAEPPKASASNYSLLSALAKEGLESIQKSQEGAPSPSSTTLEAVGRVLSAGSATLTTKPVEEDGSARPLPGLIRRRRMGLDSLPARILTWMEKYPPEMVHKAETICEAFSDDDKSLVLDALRRLHDRVQVQRPGRGLYQLIQRSSTTSESEQEEVP